MDALLVIFDLDGTIIDVGDRVDFDSLLVKTLEGAGVSVPGHDTREKLWASGRHHATTLASWGVRDVKAFWSTFDGLDFEARTREIETGGIHPFPDALQAIELLASTPDVHVAGFTNTPARLARYQAERFGLDVLFEYLLALDMDGHDQTTAKPEPDGIFKIQQTIETRSNINVHKSTILVGDSDIDMMAASNAGIPSIQVLRDPARQVRFTSATATIHTLIEVNPDFLRGILETFHRPETAE